MGRHDHPPGSAHHQRQVSGKKYDVAEALFRVNEDCLVSDILSNPQWLRKHAVDITDPGKVRQFPSPVVFDPAIVKIPLEQQDMREMEMELSRVRGQGDRPTRGGYSLHEIVHRFEGVAKIKPGARLGRIDSDGLATKGYRLGRCPQFEHRTAQ